MVRTRSGKATSKEDLAVPMIEKKTKTPQKAKKAKKASKAPAAAAKDAEEPRVSFDKDVNDLPGKSYLKSPRVKLSSRKKSLTLSTTTSYLWDNVKDSPFFFSSSVFALMICGLIQLTVWSQLQGNTGTLLQFLFMVVHIHQADIMANIMNRLLDGDMNSDCAYFFTESALNVSEVMLLLYTVSKMGETSFVTIAIVVTLMFPACWLNVRFREEDKLWVRCLAYAVLVGCVAMNWKVIESDMRLQRYAICTAIAMVMDIFDLPDGFISKWEMCDGVVMVLRSAGCYMLITHELLKNNRYSDTTLYEQMFM